MAQEKEYITLIDENNKEIQFELLFSFNSQEYNTRYLFVVDPSDETGNSALVFKMDENGNVTTVDDSSSSETDYINKIFDDYQNGILNPVEDEHCEDEDCSKHHHHCGHDCTCTTGDCSDCSQVDCPDSNCK